MSSLHATSLAKALVLAVFAHLWLVTSSSCQRFENTFLISCWWRSQIREAGGAFMTFPCRLPNVKNPNEGSLPAIKDKAGLFGCHLSPPLKTRTRKIDLSKLAICHLRVVIRQIIYIFCTFPQLIMNRLLASSFWASWAAFSWDIPILSCDFALLILLSFFLQSTRIPPPIRHHISSEPKWISSCLCSTSTCACVVVGRRLHDLGEGALIRVRRLRWLTYHRNRAITAGMSRGHNFEVLKITLKSSNPPDSFTFIGSAEVSRRCHDLPSIVTNHEM